MAKSLGISSQTLHNWVKADAAGRLCDVAGKTISADQMEIACVKAELARTRTERDILKKGGGVFCEGVAVRYAFIERHRKVWPVAAQCRALNVNASGFH